MHKYCIHHHLLIISRTFHVSGRLRVPKNRIENLEYGDLTDAYNKATETLNANEHYLSLSNNVHISLPVLRTKIGECMAMVTRFMQTENYDSIDAALESGQPELIDKALQLKSHFERMNSRRAGKQVHCLFSFI